MPINSDPFFFGVLIIVVLFAIVALTIDRVIGRKSEIRVRRERFDKIREGKENENPKEAILWLEHMLYGMAAVSYGSRRYHITGSDLGISRSDYRQVIITLFGIWWNELEANQPTIFAALDPFFYFDDKFCEIMARMDSCKIDEDVLGKKSSLLMTSCAQNCRAMLENALQFYPEAPGTKPSVGELHEALLKHWINPTDALKIKWYRWVKAAYLRQAKHILVRLRDGQHYLFPESDTQVDNLIALLACANSAPNAINTRPVELQKLRGFMTGV